MKTVSELLDCRSETYEVFNFHNNVLLTTSLILFSEKRAKCTIKVIQIVSSEAMHRPEFGFVVGFPSKLGCGTIYGHDGKNTVEEIFVRNVHREVDVVENFVVQG